MIDGGRITRPGAECNKFFTWVNQAKTKLDSGVVVTMPNDIKTLFKTWLNAFDNRPALGLDQVELTMLRGDHTALLNELNSRAEDYYDYLNPVRDYYVPAGSSNKYKGLEYYTPTPILLYYNGTTKQWAITDDYNENLE